MYSPLLTSFRYSISTYRQYRNNNTRFLPGVVFFSLLFLLSACSHTPQTQELLQQPPARISPSKILSDIPFFPQQEYQCGPAALATMLQHHGIATSPESLVDKVYLPERQGSLPIEMIATARSHGLLTYKLKPRLEHLLEAINAGYPVLVFQNLGLGWFPQWHFAVAMGYDLKKSKLTLRSGTIKEHSIDLTTFERTWQRAKHWAYIFVTPGIIPVTANSLDYTQAIHQLDLSGFRQEALLAYQAGARNWPQDELVLMAWGNAEFENNNLMSAEKAFRQALKHHPVNVTAWNNLAYVLSARQCHARAIEAIQCALNIKPDDKNIQDSSRDIQKQGLRDRYRCETISCPK
ncbi:MAG: PA2778 family cysteine peptidase [Gammaproteobacteria bacterium]|nr:PA2778 family cysteine peptidase [Gammaproteobacteria bacterium]